MLARCGAERPFLPAVRNTVTKHHVRASQNRVRRRRFAGDSGKGPKSPPKIRSGRLLQLARWGGDPVTGAISPAMMLMQVMPSSCHPWQLSGGCVFRRNRAAFAYWHRLPRPLTKSLVTYGYTRVSAAC